MINPMLLSEARIFTFDEVLVLVHQKKWDISIFIDNYNASSIASWNSSEVNECLTQMITLPLSNALFFVQGLIMGTGFAPDPLINPYSCDVWSLVAIDMTDEDVVEATFGFTVDEVHKL